MKQLLINVFCVLLLSLPLVSMAQNFTKSEEPYVAVDGHTYHIGDSIIILAPSDFSNTFSYYKIGKKLAYPVQAQSKTKDGKIIDRRFHIQ